MTPKFTKGQRVVVSSNTMIKFHEGYYGHVTSIHVPDPKRNSLKETVYDVSLTGRVGAEPAPWMLDKGFDPYPFFERELEAVD